MRNSPRSITKLIRTTGRCDCRLLQHYTIKLLLWLVLRRAFTHRLLLLVLGRTRDFTEGGVFPLRWSRGVRLGVSEDGLGSGRDG